MSLVEFSPDGKMEISGRQLHMKLGIKTPYHTWMPRMIEYGFIEGTDFWTKSLPSCGGRPGKDHIISLDMAISITEKHRISDNTDVLNELNRLAENPLRIPINRKRLEYCFGEMLDVITGVKWERQKPIDRGKYKIDFYADGIAIVEYDEDYHKYQIKKDLDRIEYCRSWIAKYLTDAWKPPVIRVKKGEELKGLNRIVRHMAGFDAFDTQFNYKCDVCDIGAENLYEYYNEDDEHGKP